VVYRFHGTLTKQHNRSTQAVQLIGLRRWVQFNKEEVHLRGTTESHTADGHQSGAPRSEVVKRVVHRKSIFGIFVHCFLKAGNERLIQTLSYELNNTVNGGGDRSIQRVKLVQQVKDKTQRLRGRHSTEAQRDS